MKTSLFLTLLASTLAQGATVNPTLIQFPQRSFQGQAAGAYSGLAFERVNEHGELVFWTLTDRGPNAESYRDKTTKAELRPFLKPDFTPYFVQFAADPKKKSIRVLKELTMKMPFGKPLSGLPNYPAALTPEANRTGDEHPVTAKGAPLAADPMGVDPEGLCLQGDTLWVVEEYGPSLLKFNLQGELLVRYVPEGYQAKASPFVKPVLPAELLKRKLNRGFEGLAGDGRRLYLALQSPLPGEGTNVPIYEFDTEQEKVTRRLNYPLDSLDTDKLGDLAVRDHELLVIEQNSHTGKKSSHKVYGVDPAAKTQPLQKTLLLDLPAKGYDFEKVEGITVTPEYLGVMNDNDFGVNGKTPSVIGLFPR